MAAGSFLRTLVALAAVMAQGYRKIFQTIDAGGALTGDLGIVAEVKPPKKKNAQ